MELSVLNEVLFDDNDIIDYDILYDYSASIINELDINNVDLLLVPSENYDEAIKIKKQNNYSIPIYPVNTIDEAIEYLKKGSLSNRVGE